MEHHSLGERLIQLRKEKGWSQEYLATELKVTRQAISNWERDKTQPDLEMLSRIAQLFGTDLDGLMGLEKQNPEEEIILNLKPLKWLYFAHPIILVGYLIFIITNPDYGFSQVLIILFTFLLMATTIYFFFTYSIKTNDYTMLAGYDKRVNYNYPMLKKVIYLMEFLCLLTTLTFSLIFIGLELLNLNDDTLTMGLMVIFMIQFVGGIFIINIKYRHEVLLDPNDQQESRIGTWVTVGFMISILILLITTFFTASTFNIQNNTPQGGKLVLFILPYTILNVIGLLLEQKNIQKTVKENRSYRLDSFTYFIMIASLILLVGMVYTAYQTTLS